jgi:hypothetical protein
VGEDDDLRINTLHRFAKHSPRLVLQEYSHCEVPAGCGGVVIRWYDPAGGTPATLRVVLVDARAELWIDGVQLATSWLQLAPGPHVVALHVTPTEDGARPRIAMLSAQYDADADVDLVADARWRVTTREPAATWTQVGFAEAWDAAPRASEDALASLGPDYRWTIDDARRRGRAFYELPRETCWVRIAFVAGEAPR